MNKKFTLFAAVMLTAFSVQAQVISDEVTMGTSNDVYYNLSDKLQTPSPRSNWDLAFYKKSKYSAGVRINDATGIEVFEVSDDFSDWDNINISNQSSWLKLFNSETSWEDGAFNQGSDKYGWGEYNFANHIVYGSVIFVLKYPSGDYYKLKINNLTLGVYNFTYSKWVNNAWVNEVTKNVDTTPSTNTIFTYYSILNSDLATPEPSQDKWDLKFTKYVGDVPDRSGNLQKYSVTGVLQSDLVKVAKTETGNPTNDKAYSAAINTIGYDWKVLDNFKYVTVKRNHFIKKTSTNKIYKLVFKSFEGSSTAKSTFEYEDVTTTLGTTDLETTKFGIYTDTNQPKTINIVYNSQANSSSDIAIAVYSINGQLVHQEKYKPTGSFTNKSINLSQLPAGVYVVKLQSADKTESKKVVLR